MKIFVGLLLLSSTAIAEIGVSAFAIQHPEFPCDSFLRQFWGVNKKTIAVLDKSFGESFSCLTRFSKMSGHKTIIVHMSNEAGRRNKRLQSYEHLPKLDLSGYYRFWRDTKSLPGSMRQSLIRWKQLQLKYRNLKLIISDGLESNDFRSSARRRINLLRRYTGVQIVHNPLVPRDPAIVDADFIELHGDFPYRVGKRGCIYSLDGAGIYFSGNRPEDGLSEIPASLMPFIFSEARRADCLFFIWEARAQGLDGLPWKPPRNRSFRIRGASVINDWLKTYG